MTRIERILKNARMVLADKAMERWTDEDLLSILDEGHKDLCQQAQILRARADVSLVVDTPFFSLPIDCWQVTRATYANSALPFVTYTELDTTARDSTSNWGAGHLQIDRPSTDWQDDKGQPQALVYDRRNMTEGRVYPTPTIDDADQATLSSPFGVATDVVNEFGVSDPGESVIQPFGVLTAYYETPELTVYYLQIPADITEVTDDLVTPTMFDTALKYYVIGNAFLMDLDQEYQAKGIQQLGYYSRDLELAMTTSAKDFQRAAASRTTYRRV